MSSGDRFHDLDQALEAYRLDLSNRAFVRDLLAPFVIVEFVETSGYVKALRGDGSRPLLIHKGYTTGFNSLDELVHMADRAETWPATRGFGIDHPVHGHPSGGPKRPVVLQPTEYCPRCFTLKSLTGTCLCD